MEGLWNRDEVFKMNNYQKRLFLRAYDLVQKGWTQHVLARDINGESIYPEELEAVTFCSSGAIQRADYDLLRDRENHNRSKRVNELLKNFQQYIRFRLEYNIKLVTFNDNYTHEEVLQMWKDFGKMKGYLE